MPIEQNNENTQTAGTAQPLTSLVQASDLSRLPEVSQKFIETGDTDFASFTVTQENIDKLKGLGFLNILPYTPSTYGYLQVNLENEKLKGKRVRQALTYGLDRKSIYVDAVQGAGAVANIPAFPILWSYTTDGINPYNYDPEKAKKLLDEAGWPEADHSPADLQASGDRYLEYACDRKLQGDRRGSAAGNFCGL